MMAVRERAAAVMAALDRRVPSLEDFMGQSWSSWVERANVVASEAVSSLGSEGEDCSKNGKKKAETMTLRKEDMPMFGHCPAQDDFYLVVCSHCSQVVKPQAFERHCERRHGSLGKSHGRPHCLAGVAPRPRHGPPQYRRPKPQREDTCLSPQDKTPHTSTTGGAGSRQHSPSTSPTSSPGPGLKDPPWPQGSALPGGTPPSEKPQQRKGEPARQTGGPRTYRKISRKECDLDKHCGVLDPERKKLCTRLLTCNIHSIHQRRKVLGRSKNFDQLVAELKMSSKAREQMVQNKQEPEEELASPDTSGEPSKRSQTDCVPFSRSRTTWEGDLEEGGCASEDKESEPLASPSAHGRLSSEGSDGEGTEELADWHTTPWHPKPLGFCTFGSRTLGAGLFTFDRRLLHLRSALIAVVERHISAPLCRKIPQTPARQIQRTITSSPGMGAGMLSLRMSPSAGQLVTPPCPSHSSQTTPTSPGRPRNPEGRPSKHQGRQREAERKKRVSHQGDGVPALISDSNCVLQEHRRTPDPSRTAHTPHGLANGALSPGNKPRPLAAPTESHSSSLGLLKRTPPLEHASRGPRLHGRLAGHEHKGPGRKRKASLAPPPRPPRPPSTPPHPGFFSWRKEGKSLEPKLSAQKPKLHH